MTDTNAQQAADGATASSLRKYKIDEMNGAINRVRELLSDLTEQEKNYLHCNSVSYRQLVDTIRNWR